MIILSVSNSMIFNTGEDDSSTCDNGLMEGGMGGFLKVTFA